jgi:hypothetical protein
MCDSNGCWDQLRNAAEDAADTQARAALAQVIQRYHRLIEEFLRRVQLRFDADVLNQCWAVLWQRRHEIPPDGDGEGLLFEIARQCGRQRGRTQFVDNLEIVRRPTSRPRPYEDAESVPVPPHCRQAKLLATVLRELIDSLREIDQAIVDAWCSGNTSPWTQEILDLYPDFFHTHEAVRGRLCRLRPRLDRRFARLQERIDNLTSIDRAILTARYVPATDPWEQEIRDMYPDLFHASNQVRQRLNCILHDLWHRL